MSNLQQLLLLSSAMYPHAEAEPIANRVAFMNMALDELSPYFGLEIEDATLLTVIAQDSYTYPTGIDDISEIISVAIGNLATPANRYDYTKYTMSKSEDDPQVYYSYFQIINSAGAKKLAIYPVPAIANLPIRIRYHKKLTQFTSTTLTATPEFDSRFHDMLAYYCCHMICSIGSSPDAVQADMFMQKYQDTLEALWKFTLEQDRARSTRRRDNKGWHRTNTYQAGY